MNTNTGLKTVTEDAIKGIELMQVRLLSVASYSPSDVDVILQFTSDVMGDDFIVLAESIYANRYSFPTCNELRYIVCAVLLAGYSDVSTLVRIMLYPSRASDSMPLEFLQNFFVGGFDHRQRTDLNAGLKSIYSKLNINLD